MKYLLKWTKMKVSLLFNTKNSLYQISFISYSSNGCSLFMVSFLLVLYLLGHGVIFSSPSDVQRGAAVKTWNYQWQAP